MITTIFCNETLVNFRKGGLRGSIERGDSSFDSLVNLMSEFIIKIFSGTGEHSSDVICVVGLVVRIDTYTLFRFS